MNTPSKEDILKIKIGRAKKTLLEARTMLEHNFKNAALNRFYYACFYPATALLFKKDIFTKTHSGVQQMLGLHYINPGILSRELGEFYGSLFQSRQASDYDDFAEVEIELVKEYSEFADKFIASAEKILEL